MVVVTRSRALLTEVEDNLDAEKPPPPVAVISPSTRIQTGWRKQRESQSFSGYFAYDSPGYGTAACIKVMACVIVALLCILHSYQATSSRNQILGIFGLIFECRVLFQIMFIWKRHIGFLEAIVDSCMLEPLSIASLVLLPSQNQVSKPLDASFMVGAIIFAVGSALNVFSEIYRTYQPYGLVQTGPFAISRHPNYSGEVLSFVGFAICTGSPYSFFNLWIPSLMYIGMVLWSVQDLESSLKKCYGSTELAQWKKSTPVPIYFQWENVFLNS